MRRPPAPRSAEANLLRGFRLRRDAAVGRHPLLEVFPGLDRLPTARRQEPDADARKRLYGETIVEIADEDLWMYVAPWDPPSETRGSSRPLVPAGADVVVVGESHLRESPELTLFLDIFHELCHVQQRRVGRELFDRTVSYVERTTEIDAYRFVVQEAQRTGIDEALLREYLKVEWITKRELGRLLDSVGVARARD